LSSRKSKITIVGSGAIGTTIAYSLLLRRPNVELVVFNRDGRKARARTFDMSHCGPCLEGSSVRAGGADDTAGSDIIVMTAGVLPEVDGKRSDVLRDNIEVYRELVPPLAARSPGAVLLAITNPNDSMAYAAYRLAGLPSSRVLGTGTLLDGLRLRTFIGEAYGLDPSRIEAEVIGEHGDSMVPLWSRAAYCGSPLEVWLRGAGKELDAAARRGILERTRRAGWDIRLAGEHSCYGIAFSAVRIIESLLGFSAGPLTLSSLLTGECGIREVYMSLPAVLCRAGIGSIEEPTLSDEEAKSLLASAAAIREQMDQVDAQIGPSTRGE
jgi:L-lactate dehydrogenase